MRAATSSSPGVRQQHANLWVSATYCSVMSPESWMREGAIGIIRSAATRWTGSNSLVSKAPMSSADNSNHRKVRKVIYCDRSYCMIIRFASPHHCTDRRSPSPSHR